MWRRQAIPANDRRTLVVLMPVSRLAAIAILLIVSSFASPLLARAGWTDYARVGELIATGRHYYELRIPVDNPSGCREDHWYYRNYDAPGSAQMFEVLLDAIESNLRVRLYVTGVCNINGYAEISSVGVSR